MKNSLATIEGLSASLRDSKVSEVEKKAMQQFYDATMSDIVETVDDDNGCREIVNEDAFISIIYMHLCQEMSTGSSTSELSNGPTIVDDNESSMMNASLETLFMTASSMSSYLYGSFRFSILPWHYKYRLSITHIHGMATIREYWE